MPRKKSPPRKQVDIIVACDKGNMTEIHKIIDPLKEVEGIWIKLGYVPIFGVGLERLAKLKEKGFKLFLDAKLDDIPNTVAEATRIAARRKFDAINVHASAGFDSVKAVVENKGEMLVFAVTVLTSIDEVECASIFGVRPDAKVKQFAQLAMEAGVDGLICSPREAKFLRKFNEFDKLLLWTPGIRSKDAQPDDQARTMAAGEAAAFVDGMVIGRPITGASVPSEAVHQFRAEIDATFDAIEKDARCHDYVLKYSFPYEFDDDDPGGMCGHEIRWEHNAEVTIRAENDKEASLLADELLSDPKGIVRVGGETAVPKKISLSRVL